MHMCSSNARTWQGYAMCLGSAFVLPDSFASADDCDCRLQWMMSLRLLYALAQAMLCLLLLLVLSFARRFLSAAVCLPAAFSGLIPVQPFVRCQQDMHKWPVFSSRGSTTLLAFYLYLLLIVAVSRLLLLL